MSYPRKTIIVVLLISLSTSLANADCRVEPGEVVISVKVENRKTERSSNLCIPDSLWNSENVKSQISAIAEALNDKDIPPKYIRRQIQSGLRKSSTNKELRPIYIITKRCSKIGGANPRRQCI